MREGRGPRGWMAEKGVVGWVAGWVEGGQEYWSARTKAMV